VSKLTLVIGNKNYSSWSLRPWIFLRHHEIDFKEKRVPLFIDGTEQKLAEYDSDYKVPVLKDGDHVVWDSLSILEYLSEVYLHGGGWPDDQYVRSVARSVSSEMHSSFLNVRNELPMNCRKKYDKIVPTEDADREIVRIRSLWKKCRKQYGGNGEWLFGRYSITDAMFTPVAIRFSGYSIPLEGIEADYVQSVMSHPGVIEWMEAGKMETEIIEECEL
jgi:glutathione S-transferase